MLASGRGGRWIQRQVVRRVGTVIPITQKLKEQGIPANVSQSAGTYVCNHVFYGLMHYANTAPWLKRAGFVHIPYLPVQACAHAGTPSMSLAMMVSAINTILEVCVAQKTDLAITGGTIC